ncbi:5-formyltetrahydrofolate cyclo-ligase [Rhodoluna limnophila]|jgi:5-formyltetrahydrofolate cyclo-ligase|uniref:5-formyltetrahydrofolate cyclo-ligase n=1 Tax=Rhodoluna limnophila TaxID=232537 RepID=UPI001106D887|nr:5-formyltetrahydrofolate cyclo-ligase [Rhodoluna limnophila]
MDAQNIKQALRDDLKIRRASAVYDPEHAAALNVHLAELCLSIGAQKIACYLPYGTEPDTELFIDWALDNDIEVVLPVAHESGELTWVIFEGESTPGIFGFAEATGKPGTIAGIDLAIIPALAVDQKGMRLGKGKGYYDRALAKLEEAPPLIAVVFDDELLEEIPAESHDQPVDAAVTPSQIVLFTDRLK